MVINCTKKLQEALGIAPTLQVTEDGLCSWHGNLVNVNGRKTLILLNDASRYEIILHGLKPQDLKRLDTLILQAVEEVLLTERLNPALVAQYIELLGVVTYSKTQGAKYVSRLNNSCELARIHQLWYETEAMVQTEVCALANQHLVTDDDGAYVRPCDVFYTLLSQRFEMAVFQCKAVVLTVKLDLQGHDIYRKLIVPLHYSFAQLHTAIQKAFDWRTYHMHNFLLYEKGKPVLNLVTDDDDFEYPGQVPQAYEAETLLQEYLPQCKRFLYCYDFGNDWEHIITVEDVLFDYQYSHPICIAGEGVAPPEDVGGESGFATYLAIKNDPTHGHYQQMKRWAGSKWNATFDLEQVNCKLQMA